MSHELDQKRFQDEFKAKEYLENYYSKADFVMVHKYVIEKTAAAETMRVMMWLDGVCSPLIRALFGKEKATVLELGGGPTLYQLMNIIDEVKDVYFTDYTEDNLNEIRAWKNNEPSAFNWKNFLKAALMIKNDTIHIDNKHVEALEKELRDKITRIEHCDIFQKDLGIAERSFDVINTHFVAESATSYKDQWEASLKNIYRKLSVNGLLFMSALRGAKNSYKVLKKSFPAVELYEQDIENGLQTAGFHVIRITSIHTEDKSNNYDGLMFAVAQKK
jgi:hypothetical protein